MRGADALARKMSGAGVRHQPGLNIIRYGAEAGEFEKIASADKHVYFGRLARNSVP